MKVRNHIALGLEFTCVKWDSPCCLGPDAGCMVNIVGAKALLYQLLCCQVPGQLMDDGCHDFQMGKLFCSYICERCLALFVWHGIALGQISHGGSHFPVRPAVLGHYELCHLCIGFFNINRKFQSFFIYPHL